MSEPAPTPAPSPAPAPAADVTPAPAAAAAPSAASWPEGLPESFRGEGGTIKSEFWTQYAADAGDAAKYRDRTADVPEKSDGYKVEVKLPEGMKLPAGFDVSKDPEFKPWLDAFHGLGLSNSQVNAIISRKAQFDVAAMDSRAVHVLAEDKKLGEKAVERRGAVANWMKAQADKGDFTKDEIAVVNAELVDAPVITFLEKLMAKANGGIPGHVPTNPKVPEPPLTDRWYGTQQKAS